MRHEWTPTAEGPSPACVELVNGMVMTGCTAEQGAREILRLAAENAELKEEHSASGNVIRSQQETNQRLAKRVRDLEAEVERRAAENVAVQDQSRATGDAVLAVARLFKGSPLARIAALEEENRQLRERAEAAELRAAIYADALKAETETPAPSVDRQPPGLDLYPETCPRCGRPAVFHYSTEEEARRQTPLCWGQTEKDCPGWSGA